MLQHALATTSHQNWNDYKRPHPGRTHPSQDPERAIDSKDGIRVFTASDILPKRITENLSYADIPLYSVKCQRLTR